MRMKMMTISFFYSGVGFPDPWGLYKYIAYPHTPIHTYYIYPLFIHPPCLAEGSALVWHWSGTGVEWVKINKYK